MTTIKSTLRRPLAGLASLALIGAVPVAGAIALPAPAFATSGTLDNAVAALRGIETMRADFTQTEKLSFKKYDPVVRKHVEFKEAKIK